MREKLESLPLAQLREIAKSNGLTHISALKKSELIDLLMEENERREAEEKAKKTEEEPASKPARTRVQHATASTRRKKTEEPEQEEATAVETEEKPAAAVSEEPREVSAEKKNTGNEEEAAPQEGNEPAVGILEVMPEGYGFIRCANYLPGENDVYVPPLQIRRFGLKTGDVLRGIKKAKNEKEKFSPLVHLDSVNGYTVREAAQRVPFEDLTPIYPDERIRLASGNSSVAMRAMDLVSPVGKGQRGMIVSPPKAGKTTLLKQVAHAVLEREKKMHILILLIDERPEEVTDIKEAVVGDNVEVIYSTFDETPEHHVRVAEMVIERARRLVEHKEDVIILLDSITRLARAYNQTINPSGRTMSGGLDPAALHMPKRFFGAARNMREGGSLTILATALVDTGSKMDDVIYEEFKGTGNMEIVLDRKMSEKRIFPAIDLSKSGTRREDLLLSGEELEAINYMRRALNSLKADEATDRILDLFTRTRNNAEFVQMVKKKNLV
jgi:transcription termination factor Rho